MQIAIQTTINVSGLKIVPPALANGTQCVCIMWNINSNNNSNEEGIGTGII